MNACCHLMLYHCFSRARIAGAKRVCEAAPDELVRQGLVFSRGSCIVCVCDFCDSFVIMPSIAAAQDQHVWWRSGVPCSDPWKWNPIPETDRVRAAQQNWGLSIFWMTVCQCYQNLFPSWPTRLIAPLCPSASARRIQGRRSQIWALVTLTRPWTERRFRSRPLHRPKQLRRWGFQKYTWPRGINKKSHITSLNLNWNCHHQNIATCCQYKDRFTKFMESVLQKSGKLRSQLRDLSEKFKSTAQVKSYLGRFFLQYHLSTKTQNLIFVFQGMSRKWSMRLKPLMGSMTSWMKCSLMVLSMATENRF